MWKWLNSDTSGCIIKNNFKMENAAHIIKRIKYQWIILNIKEK